MNAARQDALDRIVALAREHDLSPKDISQALTPATTSRTRPTLFLAVLGGIFIASGIAAFVSMFWDDMNSAARVVITLGSGFALFVMGLLAATDDRYRKIAAPLVLVAVVLQPTGLFVLLHEYFDWGYDDLHAGLFVFGVIWLQQALCFLTTRRSAFLFFAIAFATLFFAAVFDLLGMADDWNALIVGLALVCLAYGLGGTPFRGMTGFWFFVGGSALLAGLFAALKGKPFELAYLGIACFAIYVSTAARSTALMAVGVIAMLSYIAYYTEEHFVHSIGWPAALVLLGLIFLGAGAGALRLRKSHF